MQQTSLSKNQLYLGLTALVVLYTLSVVVNLGMMELEGEEPRRAVVSLEMLESGKYFNPTLFGWPYYNKPAVFNWILIGFIRLFHSSSEWVLRLPSFVCYVLWAAVHYRFTKKFLSREAALLSAFFLLTSADIYFYGLANGAEIDVFYSFVVYLQAIAIFHFYLKRQWLQLYMVSYALCAVGFLTKGFPSLVFEGLTLLALCFYAKSVKPLFRWQHILGIAVFLALSGLYFWAYSFGGNAKHLLLNFLNESLVKSAIGERSHKVFEKAGGYPVLVLKLVAPWSLLLLALFIKPIRCQVWSNSFVRFSILFIACNLWVYWLTGQPKARYIYMFAPFACVLFAFLFQKLIKLKPALLDKILRWFVVLFMLTSIGFAAIPFFTDVSLIWSLITALVLALFVIFYWRTGASLRVWALIAGIILLRLAYAVVVIPMQANETAYYEPQVKQAATGFQNGPLIYWAPMQAFVVGIDTKVFSVTSDTLQMPPHIHPQIPYYYYRHTGQLMQFDSALRKGHNYISYAKDVAGQNIDTVLLFQDKHQTENLLFYKMPRR